MKKQNVKKLLAFMLAAVMSASLLAGCGSKEEIQKSETQKSTQQTSQAESSSAEVVEEGFKHDPVLNELGVEPFCKEEVTITVGLRANANIENYDTNYYTGMLEEVTGVNLEFMLFPAGSEGTEKLQMMVAGSETLPDIILWGQNEALAQQWGEEGYILPLEDYFANSSIYAVEGYERAKTTTGLDVLAYQTCSDGHIWSFPSYLDATTNAQYNRTWIYGPWLEALNLEAPTTTEEFYQVLKAFKTQDPNGNGKADEIPMVGNEISSEAWAVNFWEYLMNAFTHSTWKKNFLVSTDGELTVSYTTDGWKEGVKYIRSLVKEGLIDSVSFTQDADTFKQLMNSSGDQLVGCFSYVSPSFIKADHPSKAGWILLEPLTGPDGYCSTAYSMDLPANRAYITADCEHPEVAFRILDLMCREDFTISSRWGKQGENWEYVENLKDKPEYANADFSYTWMGYPAYFLELKNIWNTPNNIHWMNEATFFRTAEVAAGYYAAGLGLDPTSINNADKVQLAAHLSAYEAVAPKEKISKINYATIELQAESDLLRDELKAYVYEKLAGWLTGVSDVEADWDAYLAELEVIGLSRFLEIQNAGWN